MALSTASRPTARTPDSPCRVDSPVGADALRSGFDGAAPFPGELVRALVIWHNTRPEQTLSLPVPDNLRAVAFPSGTSFSAAGAGVRLTVRFEHATRLCSPAALATRHCGQGC